MKKRRNRLAKMLNKLVDEYLINKLQEFTLEELSEIAWSSRRLANRACKAQELIRKEEELNG